MKLIKFTSFISSTSFIIISAYFYSFSSPLVLRNSLSIKPKTDFDIFNQSYSNYSIDEIASQIKSIPYSPKPLNLYTINPREKLNETIYRGKGLCSDLVFGSSIYSLYNKKKSAPITIFFNNGKHLEGVVHQVQLMGLANSNIIVDYREGGIPLKCDKPFNLKELSEIGRCDIGFKELNKNTNRFFRPWINKKVLEKVSIGISSQLEIDNYHRFIESIYIPLFNKKFENLFYNSISILVGVYPNTYVTQNDWHQLFKSRIIHVFISKIWIYSFWISFLLAIYHILNKVYQNLKRGNILNRG